MAAQMHHDQIHSDSEIVRQLIATQAPEWADAAIREIASTGTDNALYRIGDAFNVKGVARLPLRPSAAPNTAKEARWLRHLAPHLPLPIPVPLFVGAPSDAFAWPWSIAPWFEGVDGTSGEYDLNDTATGLAAFVSALHAISADGGPAAAARYSRGVPLADRDDFTRESLAASADLVDSAALLDVWDRCVDAPVWDAPGVWVHGDIAAGNLIFSEGKVAAVIDFGALAVGDPACDLIVAWELLDAESRAIFRRELDIDDATWERGRGWALSTAIHGVPYYRDTNRFMVDQSLRKLDAVLGD